MNQKLAYEYGKGVGYGIGSTNIADFDDYETYMDACTEYERDGYRQYTPFEFWAKDFNESRNPGATWEKYEQGVRVGLRRAWRDYND